MKKYIILPLILFIFSCNEKGVEIYGESHYAAFKKSILDTMTFSFFFYADDVVDFPIDVNIIGRPLETELAYTVEIDEKSTLPRNLVQLPEKFVFKKETSADCFTVRLTNASELKNKEYSLILRIKDTDQVLTAGTKYGRIYIKVSDMVVRPAWWTHIDPNGDGILDDRNRASVEELFLGPYTDYKYGLLIEATSISDMTDFTGIEMREQSLIFKRWLKDNGPFYDPLDDGLVTVPVVGE